MSADNGIFILQTKNEFRVAYGQAIDSIYGEFDDETLRWKGNNEAILDFFYEAPIFDTIEAALDFATEMSYDYTYLEYGISLITDFSELSFSDF
jgi:hypothetical protein